MKIFRHNVYSTWRKIICSMLLLCSLCACTYDYFVDETNYYLYVPQIKDGTIDDFTVALFDNSGKMAWFRQYDKDSYAKDEVLRAGTIKIRILPGSYTVSCFSGTMGSDKLPLLDVADINQSATLTSSYVSLFETANGIYLAPPRFMVQTVKVKEGGEWVDQYGTKKIKAPFLEQRFESDGRTPVRICDTIYVNDYPGRIHIRVEGEFNKDFTKIETFVHSLSNRWGLDHHTGQYNATDKAYGVYIVPEQRSATAPIEFTDRYFPSMIDFKLSADLVFTHKNGERSELNISKEDFQRISNGSVDELKPNSDIYITIKNLMLVSISLEGWSGDIQDGGDEDM